MQEYEVGIAPEGIPSSNYFLYKKHGKRGEEFKNKVCELCFLTNLFQQSWSVLHHGVMNKFILEKRHLTLREIAYGKVIMNIDIDISLNSCSGEHAALFACHLA